MYQGQLDTIHWLTKVRPHYEMVHYDISCSKTTTMSLQKTPRNLWSGWALRCLLLVLSQLNSTQLNSKVFISRNIQYRSIATWDWNPHWFICPITIEFKKFNLVTSALNTNWLVHVHTQKHTQNIVCLTNISGKKQIFSHMWIANIGKKSTKMYSQQVQSWLH